MSLALGTQHLLFDSKCWIPETICASHFLKTVLEKIQRKSLWNEKPCHEKHHRRSGILSRAGQGPL